MCFQVVLAYKVLCYVSVQVRYLLDIKAYLLEMYQWKTHNRNYFLVVSQDPLLSLILSVMYIVTLIRTWYLKLVHVEKAKIE